MSAMSGGWPPATAVPTTVGTLLPTGLYLILTFGYCSLNAAITFANDAASAPVQMPSKVTLPLTSLFDDDVVVLELFVLLLLLFLPPPAAKKTSGMASAVTAAPRTTRFFMKLLSFLFRRRSPCLSLDRRSGVHVCRRRPRHRRRRARGSAHRTGRRVPPARHASAERDRRRCLP